ncbi:hypothetical protein ACU4GD_40850 [Cupriavidus basilensis]
MPARRREPGAARRRRRRAERAQKARRWPRRGPRTWWSARAPPASAATAPASAWAFLDRAQCAGRDAAGIRRGGRPRAADILLDNVFVPDSALLGARRATRWR